MRSKRRVLSQCRVFFQVPLDGGKIGIRMYAYCWRMGQEMKCFRWKLRVTRNAFLNRRVLLRNFRNTMARIKCRLGLPAQKDFYDYLRKQPSRDLMLVNSKDVDNKLKSASRVLKATYLNPLSGARFDWFILRSGRCAGRCTLSIGRATDAPSTARAPCISTRGSSPWARPPGSILVTHDHYDHFSPIRVVSAVASLAMSLGLKWS